MSSTARRDLFFIFLANLIARLPSLCVPFYNIDELTNLLHAQFIVAGEIPLRDMIGNTYFLTHYLNALCLLLGPDFSLMGIKIAHLAFTTGTAFLLYAGGKELNGRKAGLAAGLFYAFCSICFHAKDFQAALSESFSLVPSSLAAFLFLRALSQPKMEGSLLFLCGFFAAAAALFKAPAGVLVVALVFTALLFQERGLRASLFIVAGFLVCFSLPLFLMGNPLIGFDLLAEKWAKTQSGYISAYDHLPFYYWFTKFLMRSLMVILAAMPASYCALALLKKWTLHREHLRQKNEGQVVFLILYFLFIWLTVPMGKRVFFHYFVFIFPPLCLLGGFGFSQILEKTSIRKAFRDPKLLIVFVLGAVSFCTFNLDGYLRWSLNNKSFPSLERKIEELSVKGDRIYVWGLMPQLYHFTQRRPASSMFWADLLAGFSPGSAAMEYMRTTGGSLSLTEQVARDMVKGSPSAGSVRPLDPHVSTFQDKELFSVKELINEVSSRHWQKLLSDFFIAPPELIIDTSASDIRGFSAYPLEKYEVLKRFIEENYQQAAIVDNVIFYKLKHSLLSGEEKSQARMQSLLMSGKPLRN